MFVFFFSLKRRREEDEQQKESIIVCSADQCVAHSLFTEILFLGTEVYLVKGHVTKLGKISDKHHILPGYF